MNKVESPPDRATLPACVAAIVNNKAIAKNPERRRQDGDTIARALRLCLQSLTAGRARRAAPVIPPAPATSS